MNLTQALTQLRKVIGAKAQIKDNGKSTSQEARAAYTMNVEATRAIKEDAWAAVDARKVVLLAADREYQRLLAEQKAANATYQKALNATGSGYRYCAGTNHSLFFHVAGEADTLAELVDKVKTNKAKVLA